MKLIQGGCGRSAESVEFSAWTMVAVILLCGLTLLGAVGCCCDAKGSLKNVIGSGADKK